MRWFRLSVRLPPSPPALRRSTPRGSFVTNAIFLGGGMFERAPFPLPPCLVRLSRSRERRKTGIILPDALRPSVDRPVDQRGREGGEGDREKPARVINNGSTMPRTILLPADCFLPRRFPRQIREDDDDDGGWSERGAAGEREMWRFQIERRRRRRAFLCVCVCVYL